MRNVFPLREVEHEVPSHARRESILAALEHFERALEIAREVVHRGKKDEPETLALPTAEDFSRRIEGVFDRELFEEAAVRVRARVAPHTWEAFRLTALEGRTGPEAAAELGVKVASVFAARRNVQRMLKEVIEALDVPDPG